MDIQRLLKKIEEMQDFAQRDMLRVRCLVDVIVSKKVRDEKEIEGLLDTLLNYAMLSIGQEEFQKLNRYYTTVNQDNADFYNRHYRDLLGL